MTPPGSTIRNATVRDVPLILAVTRASDMASSGEPDWSTEEIVAVLTAANHTEHDSWLALDPSGVPVAWCYLDNPSRSRQDSVEIYARPGQGEPVYRPLLDLAIVRVAERAALSGHPEVTLRAGAIAIEERYIQALRDKGFTFVKQHARMRRALSGDERKPDGYEIRPVHRQSGPVELRRFHQVLERAFADTPAPFGTPYEVWLAAVGEPRWDEWFVATVDGVVAGVLQSSEQGAERAEGWVKNLAVLPEYRKRGIGAALLRTAFAAYAAHGRRWAGLGVDVANPTGAYRLYTSVGMVPTFKVDVYERPVKWLPRSRKPSSERSS